MTLQVRCEFCGVVVGTYDDNPCPTCGSRFKPMRGVKHNSGCVKGDEYGKN